MAPARVSLVSPHPLVVHGLASLLATQAHRFTVLPPPWVVSAVDADVAIVDVVGLHAEAQRDLLPLLPPSTPLVALGQDDGPPSLPRPAALHATAFLSLAVDAATLVETLDRVLRERSAAREPLARATETTLSPRELESLRLIAAGLSNREIAERCYLSINSVKTYVRSAYRKIGVERRSQAVVWCVQHGIPATAEEASSNEPASRPGA